MSDEAAPAPEVVDERDRLKECRVAMQSMFEDEQIDADTLHSKYLQLAREWITLDEKQEARELISFVPEKYFQEVLPGKMRLDPGFHKLVYELAQAFSDDVAKADESEIDLLLLRGAIAQA